MRGTILAVLSLVMLLNWCENLSAEPQQQPELIPVPPRMATPPEAVPIPVPVPIRMEMPPVAFYRASAYDVWQYRGVARDGRWRARVQWTPYGAYYTQDGRPFPWVNQYPNEVIIAPGR
jgi:hypothetical protein